MTPPAERWMQHTVTEAEAGGTVQEILTGPLQLSRRMLQRLTRSQGIRLNRRPTHLAKKVRAGDVVSARVAAAESAGLAAVPMALDVVHEDADVLVVNKPAGLLVHPLSAAHTRTLAHGIAHHFAERGVQAKVRPVHRLDRDTSGLLLVAKTAVAHQRLDRQLRERELRRVYRALVGGSVEADRGAVDAPIGQHARHPHLRAVHGAGAEPALTRFRVLERFAHATLVELELETGRTHQIRVHMAHLGHPLLGDRQYGGLATPLLARQALHASALAFRQPTTGEPVALEAPLPEDMHRLLDAVRAGQRP